MIHSDWHIHSEFSYDAALPLETIAQAAISQGLTRVGITDHLNFNDESFKGDLKRSSAAVKAIWEKYPFMVLGVELTPLEKPEYDYIAKTGTREGYEPPIQDKPFDIELAATKEELMALGVQYAIGGWMYPSPRSWIRIGTLVSGSGSDSRCIWPATNGSPFWDTPGTTAKASGMRILR